MIGTPLPRDPRKLPAHEFKVLSLAQRLALAPLEWQANRPGQGFLCCKAPEGRFTLMPERPSNDNLTQWRFSPGPRAGETADDCMKDIEGIDVGHVEWHTQFNRISPQEIGYFQSQAMAVQLIEQMRHQLPGMAIEEALVQAGFRLEPSLPQQNKNPVRHYRRDLDRNGSFTLSLSHSHVDLTFSKRSSHRWSNLMSLHTAQAHQNGDYAPLAWPDTIAHPFQAAVGAAITLADTWRPVVRKRLGTRKP